MAHIPQVFLLFDVVVHDHVDRTPEHVSGCRVPDLPVVREQGLDDGIDDRCSFRRVVPAELLDRIDQRVEHVGQMGVHQVELDHFHPPDSGRVIKLRQKLPLRVRTEQVPFLFLPGPQVDRGFDKSLTFTTTSDSNQNRIYRAGIIEINAGRALGIRTERIELPVDVVCQGVILLPAERPFPGVAVLSFLL